MVDKYGADTVRLFSMFAAPPEQSLEWNEAGVEGMARFLKRLWREVTTHAANPDHPMINAAAADRSASLLPPAGEGAEGGWGSASAEASIDPANLDAAQKTLRRQLHETIQKVGDDFGRRHAFNTAIAALMELLNALGSFDDQSEQGRAVRHEALETMVLLLNPVVPHISHALWQVLGHAERCSRISHGRRSTRPPWCATRSRWRCRSTASCALPSSCRSMPRRKTPRRWPGRSRR